MSSPTWRRLFNAWEEAVAPGLEEMTASTGFRDIMASATRANATLAEQIERTSRQWLHLWNLPTATDVRKLRRQVSGLERELRAIRRELEEQHATATRTRASGRKPANRTAKKAAAAANGKVADLAETAPHSENR